ncbi:MAG: Fic family protein [Thermoplasmatales archaeon]|nr:Fic family protein [Thermoplasmatales archaeon]
MRKFDYSFLKNYRVPADFLGLAARMEAIRVKQATLREKYPEIFAGLESMARVQSVKHSNAIEGIVTSDHRIEDIVNEGSEPISHSEREIAGYRDALDFIHNNHGAMKVDEKTILELHGIMLSRTPESGGEYKKEDNLIAGIDSMGNRFVRFVPTPASETPASMKQLVLAYEDARSDAGINKMLLIPCFILDFLSIHPFADGNGRTSRLLSLLMMYKNGIDVGKYISFEEKIDVSKKEYYHALYESSQGWSENKNDYVPFIKNFIGTLFLCYKDLDRRFAILGDGKVTKGSRVEGAVVNSLLPISKREICRILPDVSETTVEAHLSRLLKEGKIEKIGTYKNARYVSKAR